MPRSRRIAFPRSTPRLKRAAVRWVVLGVVVVLLATACKSRDYLYEETARHEDSAEHGGHGAYVPFAQTADPRVHKDGKHTVAPAVAIGPEAAGHALAPILPIMTSHNPLVHAGAGPMPWKPFQFAFEKAGGTTASESGRSTANGGSESTRPSTSPANQSGSYWSLTLTPVKPPVLAQATAERAAARPAEAQAAPARPAPAEEAVAPPAAEQAAARPAMAERPAVASPTVPARYNLGLSLGTPVPSDRPVLSLPVGGEAPSTISGAIEKVLDRQILVRAQAGSQRVLLPETARLERESKGQVEDLRPGELVNVIQRPGGPASTIRLYSKGPGMPQPGIVPLVGPQLGQVSIIGRIVALQLGGMLVNTGTETTPILLPSGVEVFKPAQASVTDLKVGTSLTATGSLGNDGVLTATSARLSQ